MRGYITLQDSEAIYGVTISYVRWLLRGNRVAGIKASPHLWLVREASLERYLETVPRGKRRMGEREPRSDEEGAQ